MEKRWFRGRTRGESLPKLRAVTHLVLWTEGTCREKPLLPATLLASGPKLAWGSKTSLGNVEGDSLTHLQVPALPLSWVWKPMRTWALCLLTWGWYFEQFFVWLAFFLWPPYLLTVALHQTLAFKHRLTSWLLTPILRTWSKLACISLLSSIQM